MIRIREASGRDAPDIREIFLACYGTDYPCPQFYDVQLLTKMIYSDDTLLLVAEDSAADKVVGTASVILEVGAYSDLVGEFGRLAVHPDARHLGVGKQLMAERLNRVQNRLHVGLIDARVAHPYTLKIAEAQQFSVVGFMPLKMLLRQRESLALLVRHFGSALELRNNHPRIIPEVYGLAHLAMENCRLPLDAIVDEESAPYPHGHDFQIEELTTEGYAPLLRIERGRVRKREVFGPVRLHYGFFRLQARHSTYLLARDHGRVVGAIGFTLDHLEKVVRIFELISLHDHVIRFLLGELVHLCRTQWKMCYLEIDVSAHAPRMQRTLLELSFLPAAYVPALVFHDVERLDVVRMVRLLTPLDLGVLTLSPQAQAVADIVLRGFASRSVLPRIAQAVQEVPLFLGLNEEQINRLAGVCTVRAFDPGQVIFHEGTADKEMYVLLGGEASISRSRAVVPVDKVGAGECLGEISLLTGLSHSATATAYTPVEAAVLSHQDLAELVRQRPDIGVVLYKNLALGLGQKLRRSAQPLAHAEGVIPVPQCEDPRARSIHPAREARNA
jgi:GNAT superfamily N-acetyltransferase